MADRAARSQGAQLQDAFVEALTSGSPFRYQAEIAMRSLHFAANQTPRWRIDGEREESGRDRLRIALSHFPEQSVHLIVLNRQAWWSGDGVRWGKINRQVAEWVEHLLRIQAAVIPDSDLGQAETHEGGLRVTGQIRERARGELAQLIAQTGGPQIARLAEAFTATEAEFTLEGTPGMIPGLSTLLSVRLRLDPRAVRELVGDHGIGADQMRLIPSLTADHLEYLIRFTLTEYDVAVAVDRPTEIDDGLPYLRNLGEAFTGRRHAPAGGWDQRGHQRDALRQQAILRADLGLGQPQVQPRGFEGFERV